MLCGMTDRVIAGRCAVRGAVLAGSDCRLAGQKSLRIIGLRADVIPDSARINLVAFAKGIPLGVAITQSAAGSVRACNQDRIDRHAADTAALSVDAVGRSAEMFPDGADGQGTLPDTAAAGAAGPGEDRFRRTWVDGVHVCVTRQARSLRSPDDPVAKQPPGTRRMQDPGHHRPHHSRPRPRGTPVRLTGAGEPLADRQARSCSWELSKDARRPRPYATTDGKRTLVQCAGAANFLCRRRNDEGTDGEVALIRQTLDPLKRHVFGYLEKEEAGPRADRLNNARPATCEPCTPAPHRDLPHWANAPGFSFCGHRLPSLYRTFEFAPPCLINRYRQPPFASSFQKYPKTTSTPGTPVRN